MVLAPGVPKTSWLVYEASSYYMSLYMSCPRANRHLLDWEVQFVGNVLLDLHDLLVVDSDGGRDEFAAGLVVGVEVFGQLDEVEPYGVDDIKDGGELRDDVDSTTHQLHHDLHEEIVSEKSINKAVGSISGKRIGNSA